MKRFWKIFGITLGSLTAVIIIAALVAIYLIFTPERLTPIVRNVANQYITAEHQIGDVELTFFSTFPNAAIKINELTVVNPMEEADNDTVLRSPEVIAELDLIQLLHGNLIVDGLQINKTQFWGYVDKNGTANFDVLNLPADSTEDDTTAFTLPFDKMKLQDIRLDIDYLLLVMQPTDDQLQQDSARVPFVVRTNDSYVNLSNVEASGNSGRAEVKTKLGNLLAQTSNNISVVGTLQLSSPVSFDFDNMEFALSKLDLDIDTLSFGVDNENYLVDAHLKLQSAIRAEINKNHYTLSNTRLTLNELSMDAYAEAWLRENGDIYIDADADIQKWDISDVITRYLPYSIAEQLSQLKPDGLASVSAKAKGVYGENSMPLVDATVTLQNGQLNYDALPLELKQTEAEVEVHLDMNDSTQSVAHIKRLVAHTGNSKIDAFGDIDHLLANDMAGNVTARFNIDLPDAKPFLPNDMVLKGRADGKMSLKGKLADLKALKLTRTVIDGKVQLTNLDFGYSNMAVKSGKTDITLRIPNNKPTKREVNFMRAQLDIQGLQFAQQSGLNAVVGTTQAQIETSDLLSSSPLLKANVKFNTDRLAANTDSLAAELTMPDLKAYVEYNIKDSTVVPKLDADFAIEDIDFYTDTIEAHLVEPKGSARLASGNRNSREPAIEADITLGSADAKMGQLAHIKTDNLSLTAKAERNSTKENVLLQWNPEVSVKLNNGDIDYQNFASKIQIPDIDFDYSNREFNINQGLVKVGKSDFSLSGEIRNIGPWLDDTGDLRGELTLFSDYTDVPEIMQLTNGIGSDEETADAAQTAEEGNPYMVPKGIHLSLNTQINRALLPFINETAYELGGGVYVRDGVLVIEEVGFICNAARLQLTAMYETPRRNNLFVGLDYHMLDIDLERLVDMIPQVDTVLPMLRSFRGNAEFHLAAETYLNSKYQVKWSTTRGACSIAGHDLTLIDGETFTTVAKLLNFKNKKAENQVDSISAEITLFRKEIDVYPFLMTMDKYKAAVGGRHNLDMTCNYHVSLLSPTYMGVNISGPMDDIIDKPLKHIKLEKAKYAQDFLPQYRGEVESQNQTLRQMIREALKENVNE